MTHQDQFAVGTSRHGRQEVSMMRLCIVLFACLYVAVARAAEWREQLSQPSPEFSQTPFWFWNDDVNEAEITRQMADFRAHGVYGFVIHARMGLSKDVAYMGPRWLELVKAAVEEAARTSMHVCLYDEGMYPSGSAHGVVVKANPAFAAQGIAEIHQDVSGPVEIDRPQPHEGKLIATFVAALQDKKDALDGKSVRMLDAAEQRIAVPVGRWRVMSFAMVPSGGRIRGVHEGEEDNEPNAPAAADLFNPEAMRAFIRLAYQPYYDLLKPHFGKTIVGMFTDEPSMLGRRPKRNMQPWTDGFAEYFQQHRGYDLRPMLPALFFDVGEKTAPTRADYQLTLAERLDESYYSQLSKWCEEHGVALTGHPAGATEIYPLRHFQRPGQDIVWRSILPEGNRALEGTDSAIGKCSSSVARYDGRRRNSNEVYGAFGWQLTMEEMKWLADWLMVRGVNVLYPHAFYYSVRDYRANERPPDVGPHNLWWPHYKLFADYTSRLCGLLTDSRQVCEVAVLCGNNDLPWRAAKWLFCNQVDFNYVEDWRLMRQASVSDAKLHVGPMAYSILVVDQDEPLSGPLAMKMTQFERAGLKVRYCRGTPDATLVDGLERDLLATPAADGLRCVHVVKDNRHFYLLVNEGDTEIRTQIQVAASGESDWFDAWTAEFRPAAPSKPDTMEFALRLPRRESIVLCIDPSRPIHNVEQAVALGSETSVPIAGPWSVQNSPGELGDWLTQPATGHFVGMLRYETHFIATTRADTGYALDLGQVGDFATVRLNGRELSVRFWSPFIWDVSHLLRDGDNELAVEVTNSLLSKYDAKNRRTSGLIGPVRIIAQPRN